VIQTRSHDGLSLGRCADTLMLRPTRSRVVTEIDIVLALARCNMIKIASPNVQNLGISAFAMWEAMSG
jgi:hypothetical protein